MHKKHRESPKRKPKIGLKTKRIISLCVNCQGKHPANYRGCSYIKEAQEERNNIRRRTENWLSINKTNTYLTYLNKNNTQTYNYLPLNAQYPQSQNS